MNKRLTLATALVAAFCLLGSDALADGKVLVKMATLAPKGTALANVFTKSNKQLEERAKGEVGIRFYYGGTQGDEKEILQKIKFKQLHGGAFTFQGLWRLVPEVHVLSLPYMFANYDEYNYVREGIKDDLEKKFLEKGMVVLAWGDSGFAYSFSKVPITSPEVARKQKFWVWGDDPIGNTSFKVLGITPVSLSITDVMTSLSTNLIDAANNTPAMAVAMRWYTKFKYVNQHPSAVVGGATIITKAQWDKIPPHGQAVIKDLFKENYNEYVQSLRADDKKAAKLLVESGLKIVRNERSGDNVNFAMDTAKKVREALVGKLFSRELLDKVIRLRDEYRKKNPGFHIVTIETN